MKPCAYCGRENEDTANHCKECGTETAADGSETKPLLNSGQLKVIVTVVGAMFLGTTLYLLSFGPVYRWTVTVTVIPPPAALTNTYPVVGTIVYTETISHPAWVGVAYYPAFALMYYDGGMFGELYRRYIEWWKKPSH